MSPLVVTWWNDINKAPSWLPGLYIVTHMGEEAASTQPDTSHTTTLAIRDTKMLIYDL